MTSLKTGHLLFHAAFLLLPIVPTVAKVVKSVSESKCSEFLLEGKAPNITGILKGGDIQNKSQYKLICQTYKDHPRFLTLYDTTNKIPVFSAYRYTGEERRTHRPNTPWKIEPQLDNKGGDDNMVEGDKSKTYHNQSKDDDYKPYITLDRGHLFPSSYGFNQDDKESTFTLTNIVPQEATFNQGSWRRMEECVKCFMDKHCINNNNSIEGFVVTGAQPGTTKLNDKINIPSMLWSAFCCESKNDTWIAGAHWGKNETLDMPTKTLKNLHDKLKEENKPEFNVFPETCPLNTTVTNIYPNPPGNCQCPK